MLSKKMIRCLEQTSYTHEVAFFRDGRTVRALQSRALIKHVGWRSRERMWKYKLTKKGAHAVRYIKLFPTAIRELFL